MNLLFITSIKNTQLQSISRLMQEIAKKKNLIKVVINSIIKVYSRKVKSNEKVIFEGVFILISNKFCKKGGLYVEKNVKGKNKYKIPATTIKLKLVYI